jgi:hypothetical protein
MPRSVSSSGAERILAVIPIGVFIISDAGTASSSQFRVHDALETVITMSRNAQLSSRRPDLAAVPAKVT